MRIDFLVLTLDTPGGVESAVAHHAGALASAGHEVRILCVDRRRTADHPGLHPAVRVEHLVDRADPETPRSTLVPDEVAAHLATRPSVLVPARWIPDLTALHDAALHRTLSQLDPDVLVTMAPALLAAAVQLLPDRCVVVHQEYGGPSDDPAVLEPLRSFGPRADVVTAATQPIADWVAAQLGPLAPAVEVVPHPVAEGYRPRSTRETRLIVGAGRMTSDQGLPELLHAFSEIADRLPDWRLRVLGAGGMRIQLIRRIRRLGLYDRVELPGWSPDMPSEWARGSVAAVPSRANRPSLVVPEAMAAGLPVVAFDNPFGTREQIRHELDGLLIGSGSTSALAGGLLRLATDDRLRHRLGDAAVETSRSALPERVAERWGELFERALRRRDREESRLLRHTDDVAGHLGVPRAAVPATDPVTPARARARALAWAVSCARETSSFWYVEPPHDQLDTILVVPVESRARFLEALGGEDAPADLSLVDGSGAEWLERRGSLRELAPALRGTGQIALEPWPDPQGEPSALSASGRVEVEFWEPGADGRLIGPGNGRYTNVVSRDQELVPAVVDGVDVQTLPLMIGPTVRDCAFPIDVVYTWVDGDDPAWSAAREARLAAETGVAHARASSGAARFVSHDELRYSLRSLHLFAPWVRRIHLVTAGQVPPWLVDHPQVRVVDHTEILPADALPVFNSHAIEASIHTIPDLAEHFIYFNDDFMLGRAQVPQTFFTAAGHPKVFLSQHPLGLDDQPAPVPWLSAALNNRRLLRDTFGVTTTHSLAHAPYAHRRSVLEDIEQRFPDELATTRRSPFRSDTDVSLLSSLAQHYALVTGAAVLGDAETAYIDISSSKLPWRLSRLRRREQDFICLGDHHDHTLEPAVMQGMLFDFFTAYWPVRAPWEDPTS